MFKANASCSGQGERNVVGTIAEFGRDGVPSARRAGGPVPVGVVNESVPDDFMDLLRKIDESGDAGGSGKKTS